MCVHFSQCVFVCMMCWHNVCAEEAGRGRELLQEPVSVEAKPPPLPKPHPASSEPVQEMKGLSLGDGAPTLSTAKEAAAKRGASGQK